MTTPWTTDQTAADRSLARSTGHRAACAIADSLFALLDRIDAYLAEHGEGCKCEFCHRADESGVRAGVAVAETLTGSAALLTLLAGAVDGYASNVHPAQTSADDADSPSVIR